MKTKKCPHCKIEKLHEYFWLSRKSSDGLSSYCKECKRIIKNNNQKLKKGFYGSEKYRIGCVKGTRKNRLKNKYGLSVEQYEALLKRQDGVCAICSKVDKNKALAVDHDHTSGRVRGLLCGHCNKALGLFLDNEKSLQSAITYLHKSSQYDSEHCIVQEVA